MGSLVTQIFTIVSQVYPNEVKRKPASIVICYYHVIILRQPSTFFFWQEKLTLEFNLRETCAFISQFANASIGISR